MALGLSEEEKINVPKIVIQCKEDNLLCLKDIHLKKAV